MNEEEKNSKSMSEVIGSPEFDKAMGNFMRLCVNEIVNKKSAYPSVVRRWVVYAVGLVYQSIINRTDEK